MFINIIIARQHLHNNIKTQKYLKIISKLPLTIKNLKQTLDNKILKTSR